MTQTSIYRTTYRLVGGKKGRASKINFESLRKGDYFFLEEFDGSMVQTYRGKVIFRALNNPKECSPPGNWILTTKGIC